MRWIISLVAIAACGGPSAPGNDHVSKLSVSIAQNRYRGPGFHLQVGFDFRPMPAVQEYGSLVSVHAACQLGAVRYVDDAPAAPPGALGVRRPMHVTAGPFSSALLPERPTMCELTIEEQPGLGEPSHDVFQACSRLGGAITAGPCPPNPVDGETVSGLSIEALRVEVVPPDPAAIVDDEMRVRVVFEALAHADLGPSVNLTTEMTCASGAGGRANAEVGGLRRGETLATVAKLFRGEAPAPDDPCTLSFDVLHRTNGGHGNVTQWCWSGRALTADRCP